MKNYFKNEDGALPLVAAIIILAIATATAAGVVKTDTSPVDFSKLLNGQAVYKTNQ